MKSQRAQAIDWAHEWLAAHRGSLTNVVRAHDSCSYCYGAVGFGYAECFPCSTQVTREYRADCIAVGTYAEKGTQAYRHLYAYKSKREHPTNLTSEPEGVVLSLLINALCYHRECMGDIDGWSVIASLRPESVTSAREHPLHWLSSRVPGLGESIDLCGTLDSRPKRSFDARNFNLPNPAQVNGRRILLIEDSYVSGANTASATGALRHAGAANVVVFTVARILDPKSSFKLPSAANSAQGFDIQVCPWVHGSDCKRKR